LRFNFGVAAYLLVRFTPQFLRALHLELFTKPSFPWFQEIIFPEGFVKSPSAALRFNPAPTGFPF
jgi:hypothetical protein